MAPKNSNLIMEKRLRICLGIFILMMVYIVFKLGQIVFIKGPEYRKIAQNNQLKEELIMPVRGTIYDSSGKELAVSIPIYDLWVENKDLNEGTKKKLFDIVTSSVKNVDKEEIRKKLDQKVPRCILINAMNIDDKKKIVDKIKKINENKKVKLLLPMWFDEKYRRYYPYGNFASYVLGHVSDNNVGLAGIESYMDVQLKGIPGKRLYVKDGNENEISLRDIKNDQQVDGKNVMLTIDEVLQHNLEKVLRKGYEEFTPKSITGILMQTKTGNILAMSTIPDYNPNESRKPTFKYYEDKLNEAKTDKEKMDVLFRMWRNPAVNNIYEPGSPFKLITSAAGLEEAKVYPDQYFTDNGYIEVAGQKLKNWTPQPFGTITFRKAVEQSVNTVFVQLGQRVGSQKMLEYVDAFGFGKKTNINLPGEEAGFVRSASQMGPVEFANLCYGQGISVTPIQMITAINAIGNGGKLVEPNIVKAVLDKDNNVIYKNETNQVKQIMSSQTASTLLSFMESVVNNGSGKKAKIEGYRIAGKTGSSNKVIEGEKAYSKTKFITSFVSIAPVEDPQVTLIVILDEAKEGTQSGSQSAAPIAKEILESTLKYLGVNQNVKITKDNSQKTIQVPDLKNKSYKEATDTLKQMGLNPIFEPGIVVEAKSHVVSSFPQPGEMVERNAKIMLYMQSDRTKMVDMPNLMGMTKEQAQVILDNIGLKYNFIGTGKVVKQTPNAGTPVEKDFRCSIELK